MLCLSLWTMTPGNTDSGPARSQACNTLTVKLCPSYRHTHLSMRQSTTRTAYKFLEYGSKRGTMQGITYIRGVDFDEFQRSYQIRILSWQGNYSTLGILAETCCRLCLFSNSRTELRKSQPWPATLQLTWHRSDSRPLSPGLPSVLYIQSFPGTHRWLDSGYLLPAQQERNPSPVIQSFRRKRNSSVNLEQWCQLYTIYVCSSVT